MSGLPVGMSAEKASNENVAFAPPRRRRPPMPRCWSRPAQLFAQAKKPVLAVGLGAVQAGVQAEIRTLAETHKIPVVLTPMAKGMLAEDHPCYAGVLFHALSDMVGETHAATPISSSASATIRSSSTTKSWMSKKAKLVSFDIEPADIDRDSLRRRGRCRGRHQGLA